MVELTYVYVEPSSRGKGIGTWLVNTAWDAAKEAKIPFSFCAEPASRDFFVNRGLQVVKHTDIDLAQWAEPFSGYGPFRFSRFVME
jgi:N-acetylglutamate synthase-like GNAT family acetyltransferase